MKSVKNFLSYWYFRYSLATELYMVEKWERVFIHIFFVCFFSLLWYFNVKVILNITELVTRFVFPVLSSGKTFGMEASIFPNPAQSHILGEL